MIRSCTKPIVTRSLLHVRQRNYHWKNIVDRINQSLDSVFNKVPYKITPVILVGANVLFYILYKGSSPLRASRLEQHPIFTHFIHKSLLSLGINSFITYSLLGYVERMYGTSPALKILLLSMGLSTIVYEYIKNRNMKLYPLGNDAIIRGMAYAVITQSPYLTFFLLPLPIPIKAWIVGVIGFTFDILVLNLPGLAGTAAGFLAAKVIL